MGGSRVPRVRAGHPGSWGEPPDPRRPKEERANSLPTPLILHSPGLASGTLKTQGAKPPSRCRQSMGKKPKGDQGSSKKSKQDTPPDPLIEPQVAELTAFLRREKLTPNDRAKLCPPKWPRVPDELLPYVESASLSTLAEVLKAHPRLFWHPLVEGQVWHLVEYLSPFHDEATYQSARNALHRLIEAWVQGFWGSGWTLKSQGQRGRKVSPGRTTHNFSLLTQYQELLGLFKRQEVRKAEGESDDQWVNRLCGIIRRVWTKSSISKTMDLRHLPKAMPTKLATKLAKALLKAKPTKSSQRIEVPKIKTIALPEDKVRAWAREASERQAEAPIRDQLAYSLLGHHWNLRADQVRGRIQAARDLLKAVRQ